MDDLMKREQYETERLCIRHFDPADVDSCYKGWGKDEQLGKFIVGYPMPKEIMKSFVATMVENEGSQQLQPTIPCVSKPPLCGQSSMG